MRCHVVSRHAAERGKHSLSSPEAKQLRASGHILLCFFASPCESSVFEKRVFLVEVCRRSSENTRQTERHLEEFAVQQCHRLAPERFAVRLRHFVDSSSDRRRNVVSLLTLISGLKLRHGAFKTTLFENVEKLFTSNVHSCCTLCLGGCYRVYVYQSTYEIIQAESKFSLFRLP